MIISHRGLNAYKQTFPESSRAAFQNYLEKGYPIEFDPYFLEDKILVTHNLPTCHSGSHEVADRISASLSPSLRSRLGGSGNLCLISEIFQLIRKYKIKNNALHLKGKFQDKKYLDLLVAEINMNLDLLNYFFIFDVTIETAKYLKSQIPNIKLAPSVAHEYDIKRYGKYVNNTLLSINEVIKNKKLFEWVWLDEWDREDKNDKKKKFYTQEVFDTFRKNNLKIAVVSPELHATSPDLLGGEAHEDARDRKTLFERIKEIAALKPDLICTDYIRI